MIGRRNRRRRVNLVESLETRNLLTGFTAYNGLFAGADTNPNTSLYADISGHDAAGPLTDVETGESTPVLLSTSHNGAVFDSKGSNPSSGTDAHSIFNGYVDFSVGDERSIELDSNAAYQYAFENLDTGATYQFAGTTVRGNSSYTDRWTLVTLVGAESFTPAHSSGSGVITGGLEPNQVAFWAGDNGSQGYVVQWVDIIPGDDGQFEVVSTQYRGSVPTEIDPGGQADASKSYGISGIRLIEDIPAGPPAVENVPVKDVEAFEATVGGRITTTGGQVPDVRVYYGTTDGGTDADAWQSSVGIGEFSRAFETTLDLLQEGTRYYYRSFASNSLGDAWADTTESFTTLAATAPAVSNSAAVSVGAFAAVLGGEVIDTGNDPPIVKLYYGDNDGGTNRNSWDFEIELGVQQGVFAQPVAELEPLTTYFFTTFAQNQIGFSWAANAQSFTTTDTPPLQITEVMADNATTLLTRTKTSLNDSFRGDQLTPDWIELHNPTGQVADLGGFHLTNNLSEPRRWRIPSGTLIPAGGYLTLFASGLDITDSRLDEKGSLHTNFQLNAAGGDTMALTDASGEVVFALENIPIQSEDISYGIDDSAQSRFFAVPTPGENNANDFPKAPEITVGSQSFTDSVTVEIIPHLPTHTVYYTLNERVPTSASTRYTGPITVSSTAQLRAISVAPNGKSSTVVSESYIELGANMDRDSNLPYLIVETFGDGVPGRGSDFGDIFVALIEPNADGRARLNSQFDLTTRAGIHVRGSSSAGFSKKQYRVEFWDEQNEDQKQEVLGLPKEADWIFYGPSQYDRVFISNPLMFDLSNQMGRYATRTRWVEMYLNSNGGQLNSSDYVGLYAITETIEEGEDRVDVGELSTGAGGVPVEGGFIWKNDRGSAYVDPDAPTSAQRRYIDGWIDDLERSAAAANRGNPETGFARYADVGSFIDHNILNLLAMNVDAMRLSSFYYKTTDGKVEAGPIWDFDRSLDSTDGRDNNARSWYGTGDSTRYFNDSDRVMSWWTDMFQDADFTQQYIDRWFELRENELSLENINATIDRHAAEISEGGGS